jgi:hypothetical protein
MKTISPELRKYLERPGLVLTGAELSGRTFDFSNAQDRRDWFDITMDWIDADWRQLPKATLHFKNLATGETMTA